MSDLYRSDEARGRIQEWCTSHLDAWEYPHDTHFIETRAGAIHILVAGKGSLSLVYLPGTNFNSATSLTFLQCLGENARVLAVDLPGQPGLSSPQRPLGKSSTDESWLSEVLDGVRTETKQVVVVGHSRGAAEALCVSPAQADSLVLLNPAGLARVSITLSVLRATLPWLLRPTLARSEALARLMSASGSWPHPDQVEWLTMVARAARTTGAPPPVPEACTERWKGRSVAVFTGEHDAFFPTRKLAPATRELLGIEVEEIGNVGHLSVEESPRRVAKLLFDFLRTNAA